MIRKFPLIAALGLLVSCFETFAQVDSSNLTGKWSCSQEEQITDDMSGNNSFILDFVNNE